MNPNKIIVLMVVVSLISFMSGYYTKSRLVGNTYSIVRTDIGDFIIKDNGLYRLSKLQSEEQKTAMNVAYKKDMYGYPK